jgi:hypothetical protein
MEEKGGSIKHCEIPTGPGAGGSAARVEGQGWVSRRSSARGDESIALGVGGAVVWTSGGGGSRSLIGGMGVVGTGGCREASGDIVGGGNPIACFVRIPAGAMRRGTGPGERDLS